MERTQQRINLSQLKSVMTISASYDIYRSLCFFHKTKRDTFFVPFSKPIKRISLVKDSIPSMQRIHSNKIVYTYEFKAAIPIKMEIYDIIKIKKRNIKIMTNK
ncbi:hypothetical protein NC651_004347 [Populus alba x Populus x berolinensis]|nr:hypothetical protein NC651_004347 [Populus alba x Populus x berolinensis]